MKYNVDFEVASAIFLILLYIYVKLQYSSTSKVNRMFQKVLILTLGTNLLDVVSAIAIEHGRDIPRWFNLLINTIFFCSIAIMGLGFAIYFYMCVHHDTGRKSTLMRINYITFLCYIFWIALNVFTGWIFYIDPEGVYVHGPLYLVIFIMPYFFIGCSIRVLFQGFSGFTVTQRWSVVVYCMMVSAGPILQLVAFPDVLLSVFTIALGLVMVLFSMETPDYQSLMETMAELEKTKREAEQAKEEAMQASRAKSNFLANMSHEIRTPINSVLGMDEMLLRENLEPKQEEYARNIQSAGNSLLSIINDILDFSKIESGKMDIIPVDYEVEKLCRDCFNMVSMRAVDKGLKLEITGNPKLPSVLHGDEVRVRQIITNILNNAVKYTEKGSVQLHIDFEKDGKHHILLKIQVKDTGVGISEENKKHLFQSFERIDEQKNRNIEGTGLGLAITKQLLDLMDGTIEVESEVGNGSTFYVTMRQQVVFWIETGDFFGQIQSYRKKKETYQESFQAPDVKILVVDDVPMNLKVVKGLLRNTQMQLTLAKNGKEALEFVKEEEYQLILMDHLMPEMDGIQTLHCIKEQENKNRNTPVVVLTANAIAGEKEKYLKEGFVDYLTKPVRGQELEQVILKHIPRSMVKSTFQA